MRSFIFLVLSGVSCSFFSFVVIAEDVHYQGALTMKPAAELKLWNGTAPGEKAGVLGEEKAESGKERLPIIRVQNVTEPTLAVYQPDPKKSTGTCVLIFPGGGYHILAYNHEGTEIAHWLNSIGITAVVVKYRVPRRVGQPKHLAPLQDAQRAVRLVRQNAEAWKIDVQKIGVLGFSAGAHLTLMIATNYNEKIYEPVDNADQLSARPNFAVPIYLAYALGEKTDPKRVDLPLEENIKITKETPPMFLSICDDDSVGSMGSVQLYRKLHETGISCELHIFVKGGHGYGIRSNSSSAAGWNRLCEDWLKQMKFLQHSH
ncbi:MAG: alpha/beta hydrolase [Planctomycetaceae bacterium]|jgi:acetyl esterase/lipase|nr:alpha/beta hydrolase [Planctomycetaceae bacterium]